MASEKVLERLFNKRAVQLNCLSLKFVSPQYSGVPDRIVVGFGKLWFAELKSGGETRTPRQRFVQEREFPRYGHTVALIDSVETMDAFFNKVKADINAG